MHYSSEQSDSCRVDSVGQDGGRKFPGLQEWPIVPQLHLGFL